MFIKVENISKKLGVRPIFSSVSLMITPSHKYGLIGKNGSGKTTFLKTILGEINPDKGIVHIDPPNSKVTYFSQVLELDNLNKEVADISNKNVLEPTGFIYLLSHNKNLFNLWQKINFPNDTYDIGELIDQYSELGGYELENKIITESKKLGLNPDDKISNYSGGQKTRLQLAKLFVYKSEILLLDEPTNHLDISGIEIFYDFVRNFKGILIIATHDRNLLTECINKIVLFENGIAKEYSGNYEFYQKEKLQERIKAEERLRLNEKKIAKLNLAAKKLSDRISKHEEKRRKLNIVVQRASKLAKKNKAQKTKIILNKLKLYRDNDKMQANFLIQRQQRKLASNRSIILSRAENVSKLQNKMKIGWSLKLDFKTNQIDGNYSLKINDLTIGYPGNKLVENINLQLGPKEKVAVIGPNGIGKSTLLKTLAGLISPLGGYFEISPQAKVGYLDQENFLLDHESSVISEFLKDARDMNEADARNFLHFFLFDGDMPLRKVKTLSEGEKVKLKLAKLLYSKANILLLDEPTNHLDIPSQEVVEKALRDFDGAIILVSHDKVLIKNLNIKKVLAL